MKSETIQYIPKALQDRLIALGFTELSERTVSHEGKAFTEYGITLEQAERFIWGNGYYSIITVWSGSKTIDGNIAFHVHSQFGDYVGKFPNPFTARLAGVERVIQVLEQQSIPPMEKGETQ